MDYAIGGIARLNFTRVGYHSGQMLMQLGHRLQPARLALARCNAARLAYDDTFSAQYCCTPESFQLTQAVGELPSFSGEFWFTSYTQRPAAGAIVMVGIGTLKNRLFLGNVQTVKEPEKSGWYKYAITAKSFEQELIGAKIFRTFTNSYADEILQTLLAEYAPTFVWNPWNAQGSYFQTITFRGESLYTICQQFAALSDVVFSVSPLKRVSFLAATDVTAMALTESGEMFAPLTLTDDSTEIVNQVIVLYTETQTFAQSFKGDGTQTEFQTAMGIQSIVTMRVNGATASYGVRNKEDNSANDFSYDINGTIYTSAFGTLSSSQTLEVQYVGQVNARATFTDQSAQIAWGGATGLSGLRARVEDRRDLIGYQAAKDFALSILASYAESNVSGEYLWDAATTNLPDIQVGAAQPIARRGRTLTLTIQSIDITIFKGNAPVWLRYAVKLGSRRYAIEDDLQAMNTQDIQKDDQFVYTEEL